jgi:hypothetical protein
VKVRVSLERRDIAFLDAHARESGLRSRSAVAQKAIRLLREEELRAAYASAWEEWFETSEADWWDTTAGDGMAEK